MESYMESQDWTVKETVEVWDILEEPSLCPSCGQEFDLPLLLPCSHTICRRCVHAVAQASGNPSSHTALPGRVTPPQVPCPRCRLHVELPCREWACATRCLPVNPALALKPRPAETPRVQAECQPQDAGRKSGSDDEASGIQEDPRTCQQARLCDIEACAFPGPITEYADWPQDGAVDLLDEEMEQSVKGLVFSLDPNTAAPPLILSGSALTVTFQGQDREVGIPVDLEHQAPRPLPLVCAAETIMRGQFYWEVDVCNSTLYRIGVSSRDSGQGWWLERRGGAFSVVFDGRRELLPTVPPKVKTVGVFLNTGGGALSFHNVLTQEHLATLPSRFSAGVRPALGLGQGRLRLHCGLPPPPHVFLSRSSAYRHPAGAGAGRWRRDVRFQSVRTFIQKFEELSATESDSGLVSSFGSCSTLASLPDPGT